MLDFRLEKKGIAPVNQIELLNNLYNVRALHKKLYIVNKGCNRALMQWCELRYVILSLYK